MELQGLYELHERLGAAAVAGVNLIGDDFRLRRAVEQIRPLAQAVPVIKKLYTMAENVMAPDCEDRPGCLLDALALSEKVAAKIGTEGCTFAESIAEQYGFEVIQYESSSDMYQAVIAGEAVACFEDYPVIGYEISRGLGLTLPTPMEKGSSYGFATLKGANPELVEMFNKGLENIKASGRYDEILNTYIAK